MIPHHRYVGRISLTPHPSSLIPLKHLKSILLHTLSIALVAMLFVVQAQAQYSGYNGRENPSDSRRSGAQKDTTANIPRGLTTWRIDPRFGSVIPTVPDTVSYLFHNSNFNDGLRGEYLHTGNVGSPRQSMIYNGQNEVMTGSLFIFAKPYSMALNSVYDCIFTNTKSPISNLTWMAQGGKLDGEERVRALFATNVNRRVGLGFKVDYQYGLGYYQRQQHSSLAAKIYGSYRGDRYSLHAAYILDRTQNSENGGLTEENYITHPEYYTTAFNDNDMPVRLSVAQNELNVNTLFLTHRYNLGYYQQPDSVALKADSTLTSHFVGVAGIVHTMRLDHNQRYFHDRSTDKGFYFDPVIPIPANDSIYDPTRNFSVENTLALEMSQGFRKWVKTGMRLYARHQYVSFTLPDEQRAMRTESYQYITIGAQLMRETGNLLHYNVLGELRTTGEQWGEFNIEGNMQFDIPVRKDSIRIGVDGFVRNETPSYYYRHYHGTYAWWDRDDLSNVFHARVAGTLGWRRTRLQVAFETIQNHVYFQERQILPDNYDASAGNFSDIRYGVDVAQSGTNVQVLSAALSQDFRFGPLYWDNVATFQLSSDDAVLPLPKLHLWTNLYFHFRIAKVLQTDLGADCRFFTKYDAPAYSPIIGQYAVQDPSNRISVGNYPWVNAYVNFHLKSCRFYIMYSHVNSGSGRRFLTPRYPTHSSCLRFGISWNFFN